MTYICDDCQKNSLFTTEYLMESLMLRRKQANQTYTNSDRIRMLQMDKTMRGRLEKVLKPGDYVFYKREDLVDHRKTHNP